MKAKLGDFGVSQLFCQGEEDTITKTEGTYHFMAPECCDPDVSTFGGKAVDMWALGVTLYCLIYNQLPYWDETDYGLFQKIHKDE
jgi:calcium/calmodulin-dependent protein kinase kinase 2